MLTGSPQVEGAFRDPCRAGIVRNGIADVVPLGVQLAPPATREPDEERSVRIVRSC